MAGTRKVAAAVESAADDVTAESLPWPVLGESLRYTLTETDAQAVLGRRTAMARFLRLVDPRLSTMPGVFGGQVVAAENGEQPSLVLLLPGGDTWTTTDASEGTSEGTWARLGTTPVPEGTEV